ncbi:MAG TPA: hypothetical protein VK742_21760 [Candidatus Sulfotelmatobacter sp.]|jgi:hypothetical protein|nr:hypothetical protein [Candidatus Sulfotelmatobacter sp.]
MGFGENRHPKFFFVKWFYKLVAFNQPPKFVPILPYSVVVSSEFLILKGRKQGIGQAKSPLVPA